MQKISRGRPRFPLRTRARVIELGNRGLSAKEIIRELQEEGFDRIPTERTIQYILADYWRLTHEEQAKDAPLDLFHIGLAGLPMESLPLLLEAVARDAGERLTGRMASWLWWVHNAASGMDIQGKLEFAEYLAAANLIELVYGEKMDNQWLISLFAMRPWAGQEAGKAYSEAVQRGLIPGPPSDTEFRATTVLGRFLARDQVSQSQKATGPETIQPK